MLIVVKDTEFNGDVAGLLVSLWLNPPRNNL